MEDALSIPGWVNVLQNELFEADRSAFHAQVELWKRFADYPDFPQADAAVYQGWFQDRYLDWKVVEFTLHIRPVSGSFWYRLKNSWLNLTKQLTPTQIEEQTYVLVAPNDEQAQSIKVRFEKVDGKIQATYQTE